MADLIGVMEHLWFHKNVLFSESTLLPLVPKNYIKQPRLDTDSLRYPSSSITSSLQSSSSFTLASLPDEELSSNLLSPPAEDEIASEPTPISTLPCYKDYSGYEKREENDTLDGKERPTKVHLVTNEARSHSSAPKRPKRHVSRHSEAAMILEKSMSSKSFEELELEEVQGFMDLGFKFKKEHLSPRLLRVVPGLQRLELLNQNKEDNTNSNDKEEAEEGEIREVEEVIEEEEEKGIVRPYLSEAWLIKRPDSPLISFSVPRVFAAADMKKHLRFWARTVAFVTLQQS